MPPVARYPSAPPPPPGKYASASRLAARERERERDREFERQEYEILQRQHQHQQQVRQRRDSCYDVYSDYTRLGPPLAAPLSAAMLEPEEISSDTGSTDSIRDEIKASGGGRNYVDPWDLENYVYLKRQISGDGDSDPVMSLSTGGGDVDSTNSDFYYVSKRPLKGPAPPPPAPHAEMIQSRRHSMASRPVPVPAVPRPPRRSSKSMTEIEEEMSLYEGPYDVSVEMEKLFLDERARRARRQSAVYSHAFPPEDRIEMFQNGGYECDYGQNPYMTVDCRRLDYPLEVPRPYWQPPPLPVIDSPPPLYVYHKPKLIKANSAHPRHRRISHSSTVSSSDDYCSSSDAATGTPLLLPEAKIGMSTFGHMKIDYSWNWNNLDRYIAQY